MIPVMLAMAFQGPGSRLPSMWWPRARSHAIVDTAPIAAADETREALQRHLPAVFDGLEKKGFAVIDNFLPSETVAVMREEAAAIHRSGRTSKSETVLYFEDGSAKSLTKPGVFAYEGLFDDSSPALAGAVRMITDHVPAHFNERFAGTCALCTVRYANKLAVTTGNGASNPVHLDRFREGDERKLTMIIYLQSEWCRAQGGCFRMYQSPADVDAPMDEATLSLELELPPIGGRLLAFWSDTMPHAVAPTYSTSEGSHRWALTIWFPRQTLIAWPRLTDWLHDRGGSISDALAFRDSPMGVGFGMLAARDVCAGEKLIAVPGSTCISPASAVADPDIGDASRQLLESSDGSSHCAVVMAALLALAHFSPLSAARQQWGPYVDSLPWSDDTMHPILRGDASVIGPRLAMARASAQMVREMLRKRANLALTEEHSLRAIVLIASRAFAIPAPPAAAVWASPCLVPILDMANHPSIAGVRHAGAAAARFEERFFSTAAWKAGRHPQEGTLQIDVAWSDADNEGGGAAEGMPLLAMLTVRAPQNHSLKAGEEMFCWYGDAGWGEPAPEARAAKEADFISQYGFSPWR